MANFQSGLFNFCRSDIGRALAISLALHALLLLQTVPGASSLWSQRGPTPTGNSLDATLRGTIVPPMVAQTLLTNSPVPSAPAVQRKQLPAAVAHPNDSSPGLPSGSARPSEIGAAANALPTGRDAVASGSSVAMATPSGEEGVDANGLRLYRLSLAVESRRFKRYPQEALEQRWSGTAQVRVAIAASGVPQSVQLLNSSGHEVLDAVALEMVGKAALKAVVPASLRGRPFSVPLPVEFRHGPD
ncbi:MAG: energy transducer TonB [Rhodocyclaceae bacterium]|nr:MAG: energy transducer TonB [Rhodocyclaceae bacterium]